MEDPPILENTGPGRTFLLKANRIGSISLGSPVFFRDFDVGEVLGWDVADMAQDVTLHVLIRAPFVKYVHDQSRFWNASGAQLKLGGSGVQLHLQSLRALLLGGIAFETPEDERGKPPSQERHEFPLFADQDAADSASFATKVPFVAYFDESVAGLGAPSDVLLQGLRIGDVQSVSLEFDTVRNRSRAVVRFEVEPDRIEQAAGQERPDALFTAQELLKRGMRAHLVSGSLITGSVNLGIEFGDGKEMTEVRSAGGRLIIPTTAGGGGLGDVATSAGALMAKLRELPIEQIGANLNATLAGAAAVTNGPALTQTLQSAQATMRDLQETVRHLDQGTAPLLKQLPEIASGLRDTVNRANKLIGSAQTGYGDDSKFQRDLQRVLSQLSEAARSVRALADLLDQHPEALIRGRTSKAE